MKIFTVRHGQTNYNLAHLGNDDPTVAVRLTTKGKDQAKIVAKNLENVHFDAIFISELPRTHETANIINEKHQLTLQIEKRLNDRKTGCEGQKTAHFHELIKDDLFNRKIVNGESFEEEKVSVFSFLNSLKNYETVLIVSHHEIIKIITGYFNELTNQEMWELRINNCEIGIFEKIN